MLPINNQKPKGRHVLTGKRQLANLDVERRDAVGRCREYFYELAKTDRLTFEQKMTYEGLCSEATRLNRKYMAKKFFQTVIEAPQKFASKGLKLLLGRK